MYALHLEGSGESKIRLVNGSGTRQQGKTRGDLRVDLLRELVRQVC